MNGRSSMNDVTRDNISPSFFDGSPNTMSKKGLFAYAQPAGGNQFGS